MPSLKLRQVNLKLNDYGTKHSKPASGFLSSQTYNSSKPKAYLNWIFLDEQFKYCGGGFDQVGDDEEFKIHLFNNLPVNKSGYLYIYVSNETPNIDVFFDNLQVTHIRGPLLEESHYYPFGLTMAGLSSKALAFGEPGNRIKFQGQEFANKEFSDGSGLEMYEFKYRMHDPQTGRFWQIDPLSDKYVYNSTYAFSENHVTSHVELEGLEKVSIKSFGQTAGAAAKPTGRSKLDNIVRNSVNSTGNANLGFAYGVLKEGWSMLKGAAVLNPMNTNPDAMIAKADMANAYSESAAKYGNSPTALLNAAIEPKLEGIANGIKNGDLYEASTNLGGLAVQGATLRFGPGESSVAKPLMEAESGVFLVTKDGVVLPKGAKIPAEFVENPFRSSSYGLMENGKFVEKLRIDAPTPAGKKGPNFSHFHLNGSSKHLTENWQWW